MMPLLCSVLKASDGSFMLLVIVFLLLRKAELLVLSDCVELFTKAWSSAVNDLYVWPFIVRVLIDLMCHLPRIGYEEAGNQSFERWGCLSLFLSPSLTLSLFLCLCPPGFRGELEKKKKNHSCTQRFLFLALQGEKTIREPLFCPWLTRWWFFLRLTWTCLNRYSHISTPHNDSHHFTSHSMFKDRKKTLPLGLPCQHFVVVCAIQGFRCLFCLYFKYSA